MAKIATLKNFSQMGNNGLFYLEGFAQKQINGNNVLSPSWENQFKYSEDTAGFTNLTEITGMDNVDLDDNGQIMAIDTGGYIHSFNYLISLYDIGEVHRIIDATAGVIRFGDIAITKDKTILYTTEDYLGVGWVSQCTNAGAKVKIIDTGKNFDTLGMGTTAGIDKVFNLTKKEEMTITSLSTTTNTNDTLNFNAGTNDNDTDDYYAAFCDTGNKVTFDFFATTAYPQFKGQRAKTDFRRQICLFDVNYLITNGNYLAALNVDESTWNDNFKQLPDNTDAIAISNNQSRILVGGDKNGQGKLLLWDAYSDGWLSILETGSLPTAITPFGSGWTVLIGTVLYYTDGYALNKLAEYPDNTDFVLSINNHFNCLKVHEGKIIIAMETNQLLRNRDGIGIFEQNKGWVFVPFYDNTARPTYGVNTSCIFVYNTSDPYTYIFTSFTGGKTHLRCINKLVNNGSKRNSVIMYLNLEDKRNIKNIRLNLSGKIDNLNTATSDGVSVSVSAGDGRYAFFNYGQVLASCTTTAININGTTAKYTGKVGQEIRFADGPAAGERTFIQSIANAGANPETWTVSPALSAAPDTSDFLQRLNLKLQGTKTLDVNNLPDTIDFLTTGIISDKLFLEIEINCDNDIFLDLHSIEIYD